MRQRALLGMNPKAGDFWKMVAWQLQGGLGEKRERAPQAMTTLVTGAAGFLGRPRGARQLVARGGNGARAGEGASSKQPSDQRFVAGVCDWRFKGRGFAGPGDGRSSAGCITLRRITGCGPRERRIFTIRTLAGPRICWRRPKRAGVEQLIYTSTVATIAVEPAGTAERIYRRETARDGGALQAPRSGWRRREVLQACRKKACR